MIQIEEEKIEIESHFQAELPQMIQVEDENIDVESDLIILKKQNVEEGTRFPLNTILRYRMYDD